MEKKCVHGMCVEVERTIHESFVPCVGCQQETQRCVKLYKRQGSDDTICAEIREN